jgi:hypothetical protein
MAPAWYSLNHPDVRPGNDITLSVELIAHKHVPDLDPSYVSEPGVNIASCLWDDAAVWTHNNIFIERIRPVTYHERSAVSVEVHARTAERRGWSRRPDPTLGASCRLTASLYGMDGVMLVSRTVDTDQKISRIELPLGFCEPWAPDSPTCYRLSVSMDDGSGPSTRSVCYGYKLVGDIPLRGISYTWPFWLLGGAQSYTDAYDASLFERTVIEPLKKAGGNTIFFEKAPPPERLLDVCDRAGVYVGLEFPYFRTANSIAQSEAVQWRFFYDMAVSHPCVCFADPWDGGGELLAEIRGEYSGLASGQSARACTEFIEIKQEA